MTGKNLSEPHFLAPWEQATGVAEAASPGLAPARWGWRLTWALTLLFGVLLWGQWGVGGLLLAWVFARLLALDLTIYTLPNIYTIPLLAVGLVVAMGSHFLLTLVVWVALALLGLGGRYWPREGLGVGEGDLKLLAAMLAWLGPLPFLGAVAIGCLLWLPGAFAAPKQALPLGVPLLLGWVVVLAFPHLPNALFSPIAF